MQTFLPYPSFADSAKVLDRQRLGKQRVENLQIMQVLAGHRLVIEEEEWRLESLMPGGWTNHPAVLMWKGYELALFLYQVDIVHEWMNRGYRDTCLPKTAYIYRECFGSTDADPVYPPWLGDELLHISHQSNLIRKDPKHYGPIFDAVPDDIRYVWPVQKERDDREV